MAVSRIKVRITIVVFAVVLLIVAAFQYRRIQRQRAEELEYAIVRIPRETSMDDVRELLGPPEQVTTVRGVFMDGGSPFLDESNSRAAQYGESQEYRVFHWKRGPVTAAIYAQDNKVKARSAKRKQPRRGWSDELMWLIRNVKL